MEENKDIVTLNKKDIIRYLICTAKGFVVIIFGLALLSLILNWGKLHNLQNPFYAMFYCLMLVEIATVLFVGILMWDTGEIKYDVRKLKEELIDEIRECRNLAENIP